MIIQSPQFTELISIPHLYQKIMEDLFAHFFTDSTVMYSKEDIEFFMTFTNEQDILRIPLHSDDQPQNLLNLSKFKIYLDRILCKGWSESGAAADPLEFYKLEVNHNLVLKY